jgi:hypothetical protein
MPLIRTIQYKAPKRAGGPSAEGQTLDGSSNWAKFSRAQLRALLLLTVFAANFFVVCHCSARAAEHASCCSKKIVEQPPCIDGNECGVMHAVKFNLLEKQAAKKVSFEPVLAAVIVQMPQRPLQTLRGEIFYPDIYTRKHPPPDYQSLYQCFLI